MSLTNPNTPVSQQDLHDFYHKILPYMSGGSGGAGGGHVIEDSEGTDLTQRDTLQFGDGFLAEDDSTNEKSVVSLDVMQSGDMDDVINPVPMVPSRAFVVNKFSKSDLYSTDEKMIGRWHDGKPLYQKTIQITMPSANASLDTTVSNLESVVSYEGIFRDDNGCDIVFNPIYSNATFVIACYYIATTDKLKIDYTGNPTWAYGKTAYVTIKYTKTTDSTAVPISDGNDYSADEQIVGTWLNGETLYQKTLKVRPTKEYPANTNTTDTLYTDSTIDELATISGTVCNTYDNYYKRPLPWFFKGTQEYSFSPRWDSLNKCLQMEVRLQGGSYYQPSEIEFVITIQYTKTT